MKILEELNISLSIFS